MICMHRTIEHLQKTKSSTLLCRSHFRIARASFSAPHTHSGCDRHDRADLACSVASEASAHLMHRCPPKLVCPVHLFQDGQPDRTPKMIGATRSATFREFRGEISNRRQLALPSAAPSCGFLAGNGRRPHACHVRRISDSMRRQAELQAETPRVPPHDSVLLSLFRVSQFMPRAPFRTELLVFERAP